MSQRSKGRGSAKDHMAAHRTTGEPVLPTVESQQLVSMTPLQPPDFVLQNEFWLHGGIWGYLCIIFPFLALAHYAIFSF